ncbi:MAG TPA: flagellar motor switch protein FliG [Planctomycetota bacterium]|nr:flagellar motor switch protein FliG [Planctomycetota bacterium]
MADKGGEGGPRKAAILMVSLEPDAAGRLMAQLEKPEQEKVALEIVRLEGQPPSKEERERVLREFYQVAVAPPIIDQGGTRAALKLLEKVHPPAEAQKMVDSAESSLGRGHFAFLTKTDPENLVAIVGDEHPQMVALIVSHLPPDRAAKIIESLPTAKQQEVVKRLANMEPTNPAVITQVERALEGRMGSFAAPVAEAADGVSTAALLLNQVQRSTERSILEGLKAEEPELVEKIRRLMFTYADLIRVNDRGIQNLLKSIDASKMSLAMKIASPELKDKFFKNMSKRAVERITEEMELIGPVRATDVEAAQHQIVDEALRLEEAGELVIEGRGGSERVVA